ncbi:MAG: hypothetical protein AAF710_00315 [Planctomycetota bacterium]
MTVIAPWLLVGLLGGFTGCPSSRDTGPTARHIPTVLPVPPLDVTYLPERGGPVTLDDPRWDRLPALALMPDAERIADGVTLREPGTFRLAHHESALLLRIDFVDTDLICTADGDGDTLFRKSDVVEWFIGPPPTVQPDGTLAGGWYLELHASPTGLRTAYFWSRPRIDVVLDPPPFDLEVRASGTVQDGRSARPVNEADDRWSALLTLPWSVLQGLDSAAALGTPLTTLIARYSYGHRTAYRGQAPAGPELSMHPPQPRAAFHLRPFHAPLRLLSDKPLVSEPPLPPPSEASP